MNERGEYTHEAIHDLFGGAAPRFLDTVDDADSVGAFKDVAAQLHKASNITERASEMLLDHLIHAEKETGIHVPVEDAVKKAVKFFGKAKKKNRKELSAHDAIEGGFSFSDFLSGAKNAAAKYGPMVAKAAQVAADIAPKIAEYAPKVAGAAGVVSSFGRGGALLDQQDLERQIGGMHLGGASLGGAMCGGEVVKRGRGRPRKTMD